mgnify:FL=1
MNTEEVRDVLAELHKISGFRVSLHNIHFEEIVAYPDTHIPFCHFVHENPAEYERCRTCDRLGATAALRTGQTNIYKCRYGLIEAVSPLYNFGILTGYLMMGQVRPDTEEAAKDCDLLTRTLIPDAEKREELLSSVPAVKEDLISSYAKIMRICAEYLTLSNAVPAQNPGIAILAKKYLSENFREKVVLGDVCRALCCSKSTLLTAFRKAYGTTVNAYLCDLRLKEAERQLYIKGRSLGEIATAVGFNDQSYFTKVFTQKYGISPSEYRKEKEKEHEDSSLR